MEVNRPIYWHQGLFLQPQHFQLNDAHGHYLHKPLRELGLPHFWGAAELEVAESGLANRRFELSAAKLLFRDGTFIEYPGNALIPPRSFEKAWTEGDKPFMVYLGLRRLNEQENNVTVLTNPSDTENVSTRFITLADPEEVSDLYGSGPLAQVKSLTYFTRIFWETEINQTSDYELLPVARLVRDGDTIRVDRGFVPPAFALSGSSVLINTVKDIRDEVAGRARQLEEYKSPREMQKAEFDASYLVYLLALRSLNRYGPLLFHFSESRQVHPWQVYGALRQLAGELSSFSERLNMLGETPEGAVLLPPYDHQDLGRCFSAVAGTITQLLNEITVGPEFLVRLELQDAYFIAAIPKEFFAPRNRYYMVLRTEADPDFVTRSFETEAKLAARDHLPEIIRRALPGVELIHMPVAPQGLPRRSYSFYFRIEQMSEEWEAVEQASEVSLYWAEAPDDLKIEIVVLRR